nr:ribonuclease H-like domain-containing protein [Tanacetum cinerariifolium]
MLSNLNLFYDTYPNEQGDNNIILDSLDMSTNGDQADHDDDDFSREHDLLASLIEKLKLFDEVLRLLLVGLYIFLNDREIKAISLSISFSFDNASSSVTISVVSAAKFPILNPNEFDLWKMRIEQYFLITYYSLWEVILNGDSPIPTIVIDGVVQPVSHKSAEQKLARRNELKARVQIVSAVKIVSAASIRVNTKMRIKQYFLMTDYSVREVILNGDSPIPTMVVDGVVQHVAPTTAEQRLAKKNELKARGALLMALPDKHQLKYNIHKDAKSLMKAIEKRFGGNKETKKSNKTDLEDQSLDDLFNSLKIYEAEVKSSSSTSPIIQNSIFLSSQNTDNTNESVSVVTSVSAASAKVPVFALLNVDNLSDAIIYSLFASQSNSLQLDNNDLKQIDADDLEEMDLKWQMAMLTIRARRFRQRTGRNIGANGTTSIGFDMSKVECYNCRRRGHFARECWSPKDTRNKETQRRNVPVKTSTSNALVSQCDGVGSYDLRKKFEKAEQERNELKLNLENFQTSSNNLSQLLASQITDKTGLGYDNQVLHSTMFDSDELISSESDVSMPTSLVYDRYKLGEGYHVVPPPYTGTFMPPKPDLVFHDAPTVNEIVLTVLNVEPSPTKTNKDLSQSNRPYPPIIKDWVSDSEDEYEGKPMPTHKAPSFVHTPEHVKTPRTSVKPKKKMVQKPVMNHPIRRNHQHYARMTHSYPHRHVVHIAVLTRSRLVPLTTTRPINAVVPQAKVPHQRLTKHGVTKAHSPKKCPLTSDHHPHIVIFIKKLLLLRLPRLMLFRVSMETRTGKLDFDDVYFVKELKFNLFSMSQMCDKKNNVLFTDTECIVLSSDFELPDDNHVLFRVPKENNMYNVDLKNIVPSGDLTCLFAKATLDESNLWHRRLGYINFKTINKLVKGERKPRKGQNRDKTGQKREA